MSDLFDLPFEEEPADEDEPAVGGDESTLVRQESTAVMPDSAVVRQESSTGPPAGLATGDRRLSTARRILSVTELTVRVRDLLESEFQEVWIEGELSNCRAWNTGHLYFTLKDASSQVRAVIFRTAIRYLKFKPVDGLKVVARGRIGVYEPKGEYQLVCEQMEPHGFGALQLAFDQLKKRLQEEGLFAPERKRPLPALPRKIGVVTSLDGAAIRDIVNVLQRRYANVHLVVRPVRVQGEGAALDIARGLLAVGRVAGVDVVIVGRGGGSVEDLWAFNEESVARAIARSPVPVISAVGHETDFTIADFVADLRAATPSAAAELVVSAKDEFCGRIDGLRDRLRAASRGRIQGLSRRVHMVSGRPAFAGFAGRVAMRGRHAAELRHALTRALGATIAGRERRVQQLQRQLGTFDVGRRLGGIRTRLVTAEGRLTGAISHDRHLADARLRSSVGRLESLSPLAVLGRGYAVCWTTDGRLLRAASEVAAGDGVRVRLAKGELDCEVRAASGATEDTESEP